MSSASGQVIPDTPAGGGRRWVQLSLSGEVGIVVIAIPPWDVVDGDSTLLNTTTLDSGELGAGAIPVGAAYQHPADANAQYVDFYGIGAINQVTDAGEWNFQIAFLKNDTDFFGGSSSAFQQLDLELEAGQQVIGRSLRKRIFMEPGDYMVMIVDSNMPPDFLLTHHSLFIAELVGDGTA